VLARSGWSKEFLTRPSGLQARNDNLCRRVVQQAGVSDCHDNAGMVGL
jgi:hypothetical protein